MVLILWSSVAFVAYIYVGYPLLIAMCARFCARRNAGRMPIDGSVRRAPSALGIPRGVSIVVAARNEARHLRARVDNLLALDYPGPRQIIVVSDGSTDDTLDVLACYGRAVDVVAIERGGKAAALNAGVARAHHDVLVFADARQTFARDAVIELVAPLQDPQVGAVSGELVLDCERGERRTDADRRVSALAPSGPAVDQRAGADRRRSWGSTIADGVGVYWRYEKSIRRSESATWSTLGATGAIYAMRRALWTPLPAETILDDVLAPMRAVLAGYRVVFNDRARAFDRAASDGDAEARRKVRTLAGNYQILRLEPRLLLPWRNPVWTQYVSHKIGRLLVPYALVALMASSIALADRSPVYAAALALQCAFYLLGGYGAWLDFRGTLAASRSASPVPPAWSAAARPSGGAVNA